MTQKIANLFTAKMLDQLDSTGKKEFQKYCDKSGIKLIIWLRSFEEMEGLPSDVSIIKLANIHEVTIKSSPEMIKQRFKETENFTT